MEVKMPEDSRLKIKNTTIVLNKDIHGSYFVNATFRSKPNKPSYSVATHRALENLPKTTTKKKMVAQIKKLLRGRKLINK